MNSVLRFRCNPASSRLRIGLGSRVRFTDGRPMISPPPIRVRPGWATAVGVIGIVIGAFGIIGGAQFMVMPMMLKSQKLMMAQMSEAFEEAQPENAKGAAPPNVFKFFDSFF